MLTLIDWCPCLSKHTSPAQFIAFWSSSTRVNCVASHWVRSINTMQFEVKSACIANHFPAHISSPNCCCISATIRARHVFLVWTLTVVVASFTVLLIGLRKQNAVLVCAFFVVIFILRWGSKINSCFVSTSERKPQKKTCLYIRITGPCFVVGLLVRFLCAGIHFVLECIVHWCFAWTRLFSTSWRFGFILFKWKENKENTENAWATECNIWLLVWLRNFTLISAIGWSPSCALLIELPQREMFNADGIGSPNVRHVIIWRNNCVASLPAPFPVDLANACQSCVVAGSVRWSSDLLLSGVSRPESIIGVVLLLKLRLCL